MDGSGNVYVSGTLGNLDGNTNAGGYDAFLTMYDSSGAWQWTKLLGTTGDDSASSVAVDGSGYVYVTGGTTGNLDGTNAGGYDAFLAKYNSSGTLTVDEAAGLMWRIRVRELTVRCRGRQRDLCDRLHSRRPGRDNAGLHDAFLAKYDSTGNWQWTKLLGTAGDDWANGVAVDGSGYIYVTGPTIGNLDGEHNAGSGDAFLARSTILLGPWKWTTAPGHSGA